MASSRTYRPRPIDVKKTLPVVRELTDGVGAFELDAPGAKPFGMSGELFSKPSKPPRPWMGTSVISGRFWAAIPPALG